MSWIALDDLLSIVQHALIDDSVSGPVNAVAPQAVTNREFTKTLGAVLRRPTCLPGSAFALRLAFGEMADALLLASTRVDPAVLRTAGFKFAFRPGGRPASRAGAGLVQTEENVAYQEMKLRRPVAK